MCVCIDIDECADENGGCSDTCTNTDGTFTCGCPDGQELAADFRNCILSKRTKKMFEIWLFYNIVN